MSGSAQTSFGYRPGQFGYRRASRPRVPVRPLVPVPVVSAAAPERQAA
ncbi:hypothetical protein [Hymenobacter perfusus]|nr:hypothetical protein [Hymenobacter perfusus]